MLVFSEGQLHRFVRETLVAAGLTADEAEECAKASVFADLRGAATHGIVYIVRRTLESIREGKTVSGSTAEIMKESLGSALINGSGVVGPVLGRQAMELAIVKARGNGIGLVNTYGGNPLGLLGYYPIFAANARMLGMTMANTAPAAAPHGGTSPVLGTNPFAYAAPAASSPPLLFDIATTTASAGKLQRAKRRGEALPDGWVIDREGNPVNDPNLADAGAMLPCGGHKGSGFGILIHLLTGGLSGTTIGGDPTHTNPDPAKRGQGAVFLAIDPDWFGSRPVFEELVERQIGFIHDATPLPGKGRPLAPGERGWNELEQRRINGIPIPDDDWKVVVKAIAASALPLDELLGQYGPDIAQN